MNNMAKATCQALFATIFMVGLACWSDEPPLPTVPKVYQRATGITKGSGAESLSAVPTNPVPRYVIVCWSPSPATNITFNVYHSLIPHLSGMTLYGSTPQTNFTALVKTNLTMEFFQVKAVQGTNESDWATR